MPRKTRPTGNAEHGAALLLALLVMALVTTLGGAAYWAQWQAWQQEAQQRQQVQAAWLMAGAIDWARHILREDVRANSTDHLAEPWALSLQDVQLSSVVALATTATEQLPNASLSGHIVDAQSLFNLRNLVAANTGPGQGDPRLSDIDLRAARRLFALLDLPEAELNVLASRLQQLWSYGKPASGVTDQPGGPALLPQRFDQLTWLGLSSSTLLRLQHHATWLPQRTPLNLNTCNAIVMHSVLPEISLGQAQQLLFERNARHFDSLDDAQARLGLRLSILEPQRFAVSSRHFEVHGRLQMDDQVYDEKALLQRAGTSLTTVWRGRQTGLQKLPK